MAFPKWLKPINTTRRSSKSNEEEEEVEEPLSPATRLFHAPQLNCCIVAVVGCKIAINVDVIKEGMYQTMVKHPRVSSKLVLDPKKPDRPMAWVRTKVDVDDHIIIPTFDPEMDSPDEYVEDYVAKLAQTPMDLSKPLWEIHILNIKTKDANAIAVFRIHHSLGDGISLMSLVLACTRKTCDPNAMPTFPTENKKKKKKLIDTSSSFCLLGCLSWLLLAFKILWNTFVDLCLFSATVVFLKDTKSPVKGSRGTEKASKKFVYRTLSLDDIKLVRNVMNVTINDVILGITQAGLSRYLNRDYGKSKGVENVQQNNLPKNIRLRSTIIVNIRPNAKIEDLAQQMEADDPKKKKWEWGNSIGYILLPFHIALRDDPLDYIRSAKATIDRKKQSLEVIFTFLCAKIVLKLFGLRVCNRGEMPKKSRYFCISDLDMIKVDSDMIKVAAAITHRGIFNTTLAFSNVVGPKEEISFYGHPMTFLAPSVYGQPQALTVHFQSYMDKMTLVLAVDQNVIPEPQKLCDDIEESLRLSKQAAQGKKVFKI